MARKKHLACAWAQCLRIALTGLTLMTQSFAHAAEQLGLPWDEQSSLRLWLNGLIIGTSLLARPRRLLSMLPATGAFVR